MTLLTEGKSVLFFVPRFGDNLLVSAKNFVIKDKEGATRKKIPALAIRDIIVFGDADISSKVFSLARINQISIHFLNSGGKFVGTLQYDFSKNVFLRHAQFVVHDDKSRRLEIAKCFVNAKIFNQNEVLKRIRTISRLNPIPETTNLNELRGHEGASAKKYFELFQKENIIKNPDFKFPGRVKRPPTDPINALLSFSYSLLHVETHTQLMIAGLDPYIGFLHDQKYGHAALASDFVEIFRGPVEGFVIRSINRKEFVLEDFEEETGGSVKLSSSGFGKFFPKWTQFLRVEKFENDLSLTATIERDVRKFVHFLMGDDEFFIPFLWKS